MLALSSAAVVAQRLPALAQTPHTIRAGMGPVEEDGVLYYAVERGFFKQYGLDVSISTFSNGGQVGQALVGGALDIGMLNSGALSSAYVHGLPLLLIQCGGIYSTASPIAHLVVGPNTGIRAAKDLAGKTIAVSTVRDMVQASTMAWIDEHGGNSKAVNFAEIPNVTMAEAIEQNRIHGAVIVEPFYTHSKSRFVLLGFVYDAMNDRRPFQTLGVVGNKNWIDANGGAARRVSFAIRAAARWANRHQAECVPLLSQFTKIVPEVIASYPRVAYAESNSPQLLQPVVDVMARYAFLPNGFAASDAFAPGAL
jgi:NitT/TauT family transport system substrate-binding protein